MGDMDADIAGRAALAGRSAGSFSGRCGAPDDSNQKYVTEYAFFAMGYRIGLVDHTCMVAEGVSRRWPAKST